MALFPTLTTITGMSLVLAAHLQAVEMREAISQYGVTWTFDKAYPTGQFITGDFWVVGPVRVISVTPKPGPVDADAMVSKKNHFGDTVLKPDTRMRNGSMVVVTFSGNHAYDSRMQGNYDETFASVFPLSLEVERSLISTVSNDLPGGQNLAHPLMWQSEKKVATALKSAAVLTCLAQEPPADAFRPASVGTIKTLYRESQIHWDRLNTVIPPSPPPWAELERYFERPWIDHMASWTIQSIGPCDNNPVYGREFSRLTGLAALALNTAATKEEKRKTLIGLIQYGIDVQGVIAHGANWMADGGHYSGRKLPLFFAGMMLGVEDMTKPAPEIRFQEDMDTYYAKTWFGAPVSFQMTTHHGPQRAYEDIPPAQWNQFDKRSESYRICCNGRAWIATALTMRLMDGGMKAWKHDAFFDYCDRWMAPEDEYATARATFPRSKDEGTAFDEFVTQMWKAHRAETQAQPLSGFSRRWVWTMEGDTAKAPGSWLDNVRLADYPK